MYLKTSNKKQLAAAVTLAVMGTAWVAVPGQVWAADGGSQDHPRQYSSYTADSDRAIAIAREQKTGEDMYAAQYHENFADLAFRAKDDMGGKTITLKSMTVEGIIGADGKGAAAGLPVEESTAGKNGGIGSAVGIYSTNILNANITFGDIAIKAIGGNTYSQEITSGKYTHEGKVGVDGASDKNLNGGAGANGGNGGLAIATGVDITGSNNTATGGVLTVTATGSDGGHGGYGGVGGTAAAITTVPAKAGDGAQGADGADSTTSGTTPSTAGANGTIGGAGGDGLAGADGTAGTVGAVGLTGGIGGNGSNGGSGSNAEATGLKIAGSGTATTISLGGLVVEAAAGNGGAGGAGGAGGIGGVGGTGGIGGNGGDGGDGGDGAQGGQGAQGAGGSNAHHSTGSGDNDVQGTVGGNGGNGGAGGSGITPTGTIAQTGNGEKAIAAGLVTTNGTLNVVSDAGLAISAEAKGAAVTNNAVAVEATDSNNIYVVTGDFTVNAAATGDVDLQTPASGSEPAFDYKADATATTSTATAFTVNGGSMLVDVAGKLIVVATADKGEAKNFAQGMAFDNTAVRVHTTDAINITATAAAGTWQGAQGIEGNNNDLEFVSDAGGITVTATGGNGNADNLTHEYSVWTYDSNVTFDAKAANIIFNGDVEVVKHGTADSTLTLKSNTEVNAGTDSAGSLNISGTTMNLTDNLKTLTVADKTTLKGSTVYFYDENNQADKYNTADYRTITTNDLDASGTNELFMRTNANGVYGQSAGNDKIISTNTATGKGTYNITVFDQGMRNGYNNAAGAADKGHLNADVVLINKAQATGQDGATYEIKEMKYDNGVWAYEYEGKAEIVNNGLNLTQVTTKAAAQSSAQMAAQDANKIAAGAAVTLFGADETLMERLGDVRNSADDNDGVWAKYVGGKIKVDGLQGDNDYQYNGFAAGYDREIGSNWRIGLAGQYAKGDTSLTNGDGEIKTAAGALYGTWTGDKGHHVDIIAKVGKVDSETSAYGGTIAQKLDGDFGSTAISFAVEYGYRQDLNDGWFVEPMVRASYVHLGGDDYTVTTRDNTMSVTNDSMNSIVLRGGFLLGKTFAADSSVYLKAAVLHDFDGDINTHVSADGRSASYSDSIGGTAIEYGIGVNHKFNKDSSMYLDVERISGGDVTKNWGVNVGFRYSF